MVNKDETVSGTIELVNIAILLKYSNPVGAINTNNTKTAIILIEIVLRIFAFLCLSCILIIVLLYKV
ncbi:hypothetical protein NJT12_10550 [Flavobacterium sp. AC]|uniref:Uncharacterized protein n=1 Tax=Flavobacterium azizsancarii TaxID=2961580 RepID=A0ABT4WBZ7_9FLAO|nr:hypothetical protein [Flavobacterium azizsancarii]MDA6070057.1 hypothetical protein [Flavobacterium azizsancarii]